ncbi:MAG: hypothetical protein ACRDJE_22850 [Dehalococcoidia bacterium]
MARFPAFPRHLTAGVFAVLIALGAAVWSTPAAAGPPPDLSAALLTTDDLPAGWTAVNLAGLDLDDLDDLDLDDVDPNSECAAALAPYDALLSEQPPSLQIAVFQRGELGPFIAQVVILLPPGLADSLVEPDATDFEAIADACEAELEEDEEVDDLFGDLSISVESTPLTFPVIGDESAAVRTDVGFGIFGTSLLSVFSRRGDAASLLFMLADPITTTESAGLVEQLARRTDARLMEVLAGR